MCVSTRSLPLMRRCGPAAAVSVGRRSLVCSRRAARGWRRRQAAFTRSRHPLRYYPARSRASYVARRGCDARLLVPGRGCRCINVRHRRASTTRLLLRKCQCETKRESKEDILERKERPRGECAAGNANAFSLQCQDGLRTETRRISLANNCSYSRDLESATSDGSFEV
jgi:hypothetical protein